MFKKNCIKFIFFSIPLFFSSCLTYYSINKFDTNDEILIEDNIGSGYFMIKTGIYTPSSIMTCKPFIDIHDEHNYYLKIETKNYKNIEAVEINRLKIFFGNNEIDVLDEIDIKGNNTKNYINIGEEEYLIFKETNKIKIYPNDNISVGNNLLINYSKIKEIKINISLTIYYHNDILTKEYSILFKRNPDRGISLFVGR
jgi:hypothetical protein